MRKLHGRIGKMDAAVAAVFLVVMVLVIFGGGLARLAAHPQTGRSISPPACSAWACFLCADITWRRASLMSIELVTARLSP